MAIMLSSYLAWMYSVYDNVDKFTKYSDNDIEPDGRYFRESIVWC